MATVFSIKQHDREPSMVLTLLAPDGSPVNLTNASSAQLRVRRPGGRANIIGTMSILDPRTDGKVRYDWQDYDTFIVGDLEAVVVIFYQGGKSQSFPTEGFFTISVSDNIEAETADTNEHIEFPATTPQTYGTGVWPWSPSVYIGAGFAEGAAVRVITAQGVTFGPATTDSNGQCFASDGAGAFRLDPGVYTVQVTHNSVSYTEKLTIDDYGNGVLT